ncbi:LacI family transcriptional regulator [Lewinella aquimaris]|uniref:LacI family transcriptional regulator n=1 Tax=Neolewinella aquimaris TaxID=1835722 RepID=A0A840E207_9BACT|nr:LacI family DNA-binding transcriptional regulator [Neolewinella aquimaris]MBB4079594.1 LacI family transcriptional regulator [Neolewinella aquimaris]
MGQKNNKRVTIYDLAKELNVSPSTVSRALKDHTSIGQETTKAVKALAKQRGYRPNVLASNLRNQHSNTIGVLVPWVNRPFISTLISGIEESAQRAGYNVLIAQTQDSYETEVTNTKALVDSRVQALIVSLAMETTDYSHFNDAVRQGTPVVFVDRVPMNYRGNQVMIDNYQTGYDATQYLIDRGRKRIALFSGSLKQKIYRDRYDGYVAALRNNGIPIDESLIGNSHRLSIEEGTALIAGMLKLSVPPDAVFSTNDSAAIGAMKYVKSVGKRIPEDVAFIGMNDDPMCTIITPNLTSMSHPAAEMGRLALRQALEIITQPDAETNTAITVRLNTKVVPRASS